MATVVFSALGAGLGSSLGGSLFGLSMTAVGRFAGAMVGRSIDNRLSSGGSDIVESGKLDRIRMSSTGEGVPIPMVFGRSRVGGHVIWASQFTEQIEKTGGGKTPKGAPPEPTLKTYKYSVSLAIALCRGEILDVARVWADGVEVAKSDLNMRLYSGSWDQEPDPKIEAIEGQGQVPAYRGMAYVVFEDLQLYQFGNRIPQFNFEVCRPAQESPQIAQETSQIVQAVALIPGSGEYSLAADAVRYDFGDGLYQSANQHSSSKQSDFSTSLEMLKQELPKCKSTSLIVSWFGNDLRCSECAIAPKVEHNRADSDKMPWTVSGLSRDMAQEVTQKEGEPLYGGTPTDQSVVQSIQALKENDQEVMFYPFILMDQPADNALINPYDPATFQPALPWRGRITLDIAPNVEGTSDQSDSATQQVEAFFGQAAQTDFRIENDKVFYSGPSEWSYRRFVLHYAWLCKLAGGVNAFCIGSELRGLTQIRGQGDTFPAVSELIKLARDVRSILGDETKIGYAADWSEYFGYHPQDNSGDVYFHLDPLWADDAIDFVGIDNYMPLSDWRDTRDHLDQYWGSIYNLDYLSSNIEGGEGFDWYYASDRDRQDQLRSPISDEYYQEPWVWRYKDIRNWWQHEHFERRDGVRLDSPTKWVAQSKPIWFTEIGCAALDKATNQPNKFLDPKSSESEIPYFSNGHRDEFIQMSYLQAMTSYWENPAVNPVSHVYDGPMLDTSKSFVWAWDARPYPWFPNAKGIWSDGNNYDRGHWINGRTSSQSLAAVVAEICTMSGVSHYDVSELYGYVRGYDLRAPDVGRSMIQSLSLRYGFDIFEQGGVLRFVSPQSTISSVLDQDRLVASEELDAIITHTRDTDADVVGRVQLSFTEADGDYATVSEEAILSTESVTSIARNDVPLVMTRSEGQNVIKRWLHDAQLAKETVKFAAPLSQKALQIGQLVAFSDTPDVTYRIDQIERDTYQIIQATRRDVLSLHPSDYMSNSADLKEQSIPLPVTAILMDLPNQAMGLPSNQASVAMSARPWISPAALYVDRGDQDWELEKVIGNQARIGRILTSLDNGPVDRIDYGRTFDVELHDGQLSGKSELAILSGANMAAIGSGASTGWEILQFVDAELIAPNRYRLSGLVRGKFGTDAEMPASWMPGDRFVMLDSAIEGIPLNSSDLDAELRLLFGPTAAAMDSDVYQTQSYQHQNISARPLRPCHLRAIISGSDLAVSWIRRGLKEADRWWNTEILQLGEQSHYRIRLLQNEEVIAEQTSTTCDTVFTLSEGAMLNAPLKVRVAQYSTEYGYGPDADCIVE